MQNKNSKNLYYASIKFDDSKKILFNYIFLLHQSGNTFSLFIKLFSFAILNCSNYCSYKGISRFI